MVKTRSYCKLELVDKLTRQERKVIRGGNKNINNIFKLRKTRWETNLSAKHRTEFNKILFDKNIVSVRVRRFSIKRQKLKASQLIRFVSKAEIKRAAVKLLKQKIKYHY